MNLIGNAIINLYSVILLAVIGYHNIRHNEKKTKQDRIFIMMLLSTMVLLMLDIFSRFDGKSHWFYPLINQVGNFLIFLLNPIMPSLWILYVLIIIFERKIKFRKGFFVLAGVYGIYVVSLILSCKYGWYYTIDENNIYHRGPLFIVPSFLVLGLMIGVQIIIMVFRKRIEKEYYYSLLFFIIPPFIGVFLLFVVYGISFALNFVVISLLIISLRVQNQYLFRDYLTGVYNRKKLDLYMGKMIQESGKGSSFSAILIDIDDFKRINDTFGHDVGDEAIRATAAILQSCLGKQDLLARYGGDEFCIVLQVEDKRKLEMMIRKIEQRVTNYNKKKNNSYEIQLSMGYEVYNLEKKLSINEFLKKIDTLMYKNKTNKHNMQP